VLKGVHVPQKEKRIEDLKTCLFQKEAELQRHNDVMQEYSFCPPGGQVLAVICAHSYSGRALSFSQNSSSQAKMKFYMLLARGATITNGC
jgi:hypothetical protein